MRLRLATWNIGGGRTEPSPGAGFGDEHLAYFADELARLDADVVCLQETHAARAGADGQAESLATRLGLHCFSRPCDTVHRSHLDATQLLCVAVLSRLPLRDARFERLPNPRLEAESSNGPPLVSHDKGFVAAGLEGIDLYAGHMLPFELFARELTEPAFAGIRTALEDLVLASDRPRVLAGDLNHPEPERWLPRLVSAGFQPAYRGVATEPVHGRQIDHILVSREIDVTRARVTPGRADHYLCWADLEVPDTA